MTFWKRRNVVPCFIIYYRKILLLNTVLQTQITFGGEKIKVSNVFSVEKVDKLMKKKHRRIFSQVRRRKIPSPHSVESLFP